MRHARILRCGLGGVLLAWAVFSTGCTHNYYYGYNNPCAPMPTTIVPGMVSSGAVCDVPTQVSGGSTILGTPIRTTPGMITSRPPRVVLSEPGGGSRFPWRLPDPEGSGSLATTKVDGALSEPAVTR
jgi:hypothetical protein